MANKKVNPNSNAFAMTTDDEDFNGLTKRELFAAMAMQGLLANGTISVATKRAADKHGVDEDALCGKMAVEFSDALLTALSEDKR